MTEKKISIWFSQDACTGVWIMMALGWARASRLMAAWPRWSEPLSTMGNTRGAFLYSGRDMTWREVHERLDPGGRRGGGEHFPGVHVQPGQQGERAVADVFVLDAHGLAGGGRGGVGWRRPRAWMEGLASKDSSRSPGRSGSPP